MIIIQVIPCTWIIIWLDPEYFPVPDSIMNIIKQIKIKKIAGLINGWENPGGSFGEAPGRKSVLAGK
jgi:hypothetical protein